MALIEKYHVVAAERVVAAGETIKEGQIVSLNAAGEVVLQDGDNSVPYGIAGDTKQTDASAMPGIVAGWQNRASDYFDETKASGKMTVYHSGGEFATDQFDPDIVDDSEYKAGVALYAKDGVLSLDDSQSDVVVARLTQLAGVYPSGVPGIDINGDIALGGENDNTYIEIKLAI